MVLGSAAYQIVMRKLESYKEDYVRFEGLSNSTEIEGYEAPSQE